MKKQADVTVYPVEGRFLVGVPATETSCDPGEAEILVATGAFTYQPPEPQEPEPEPEE